MFMYISYIYIITFENVPWFLMFCSGWIFGVFFFILFFLFAFNLGTFYYLSSSSSILFLTMPSLLMSPLKSVFISVIVFFISNISFQICLRISISLLTLPICSCMMPTFSNRSFNILIIVILNSLSDNSNISVISQSGSNAFFGSSGCILLAFYCTL